MAAILADDIFKCIFLNENDRIKIHFTALGGDELRLVMRRALPSHDFIMAKKSNTYPWRDWLQTDWEFMNIKHLDRRRDSDRHT